MRLSPVTVTVVPSDTARAWIRTLRLGRFREEHPDVIIGDGGFGTWQARIPKSDGETVITRYTLRELLDRLGELTEGHGGQPGGAPD